MPTAPTPASLARYFAIGLAYFALAAGSIALTRFHGGAAFVWTANGLLLAELITTPHRRWAGTVAACAVASWVTTAWLGLGPLAGLPLALLNPGEAAVAAFLLRRWSNRSGAFDALADVTRFALAAGVIAPALFATGASLVSLWLGLPFVDNWIDWYAGHALGALTFAPLLTLLLRGEVARWRRTSRPRDIAVMWSMLALVALVTAGVFAQASYPLLFLPLLPMVIATFRLGRLGAAASVVILAGIGGTLSAFGYGPISLIQANAGAQAQFFQLYLAVAVLTVLPIAAELRHRNRLFLKLQESEARYRLIADNMGDALLHLSTDGRIRYVSPAITALGGYDPDELVGDRISRLVHPDHLDEVVAAHTRAMERCGETQIVDYRAFTATGDARWFETQTRCFVDETGRPAGVVSAIRDISHRKQAELALEHAASTDALTGLPNRRSFDARLGRAIADAQGVGRPGCIAIMDIDHFKRVNDQHGHATGDAVLAQVAAAAQGAVRGSDTLARIGGEEFGLVLADTDLEGARLTCERVREAAAGVSVIDGDGRPTRVTISIGLAPLDPAVPVSVTLRAADAALYRAKADGRDRLRLAA